MSPMNMGVDRKRRLVPAVCPRGVVLLPLFQLASNAGGSRGHEDVHTTGSSAARATLDSPALLPFSRPAPVPFGYLVLRDIDRSGSEGRRSKDSSTTFNEARAL